jgi:heme O synthase-like polyprenyltransferase
MARRRSSTTGSSRRRRERRNEERQVELASFGLVIVIFLVSFLTTAISAAMLAFLSGAIFVGAAVYQWQRRWRVNPATWIGGAVLLLIGFMGISGKSPDVVNNWFTPLIILGIIILASFVTGEF